VASWIERLAELRAAGRACAQVVVTQVEGSAPREAGARMIVCDGRLDWGTIGGGRLEQLAIERATELAASGEPGATAESFPLAESAGQCCGGRVTLFFESFPWRRRHLAVFGAGHVGQAIAGLASYLDAELRLVDPRQEDELAPPPPPASERAWTLDCVDAPEAEIDALAPGSLVLILTHSHALDLELCLCAAKRDDLGYVGLIGSERKWARFDKRLRARGLSDAEIARITCPIGVTKGSKDPRAIALSVATELAEVLAAAPATGEAAVEGAE